MSLGSEAKETMLLAALDRIEATRLAVVELGDLVRALSEGSYPWDTGRAARCVSKLNEDFADSARSLLGIASEHDPSIGMVTMPVEAPSPVPSKRVKRNPLGVPTSLRPTKRKKKR